MVCICDSIPTWFSRNVHRLAKTGKRKDIFLATKFGFVKRPTHAKPGEKLLDGSPKYVHEAVERSLKKLGTDYIDLYYVHRADKNTPIEVTMEALAGYVK